jgi:hypothetical protein
MAGAISTVVEGTAYGSVSVFTRFGGIVAMGVSAGSGASALESPRSATGEDAGEASIRGAVLSAT